MPVAGKKQRHGKVVGILALTIPFPDIPFILVVITRRNREVDFGVIAKLHGCTETDIQAGVWQ